MCTGAGGWKEVSAWVFGEGEGEPRAGSPQNPQRQVCLLSLGIGTPCLRPAKLANTESNTLLEVLLDAGGNNNVSCLAEVSFPLFPFFLIFPSFYPSSSSHRPSPSPPSSAEVGSGWERGVFSKLPVSLWPPIYLWVPDGDIHQKRLPRVP